MRPHQLVHQLAVMVVLSHFGHTTLERMLTAPIISLFGTLSFLLLGDYLHRNDDASMGRERLSHYISPAFVVGCIVLCLGVVFALCYIFGGAFCVLFVTIMLAATLLYNIAKHKKKPWLSYAGRWLAGVSLIGVFHTYFHVGITYNVLLFAICAGLLDVAGNIAGDLRDIEGDRVAQLKTLPILLGTLPTLLIVTVVHIVAYGVVYSSTKQVFWWWCSLALWPTFALLTTTLSPPRWKHAAVHGPKLMQLVWLGAAIYPTTSENVWMISLFIAMLWSLGYLAYTHSSIQHPTHSSPKRTSKRYHSPQNNHLTG